MVCRPTRRRVRSNRPSRTSDRRSRSASAPRRDQQSQLAVVVAHCGRLGGGHRPPLSCGSPSWCQLDDGNRHVVVPTSTQRHTDERRGDLAGRRALRLGRDQLRRARRLSPRSSKGRRSTGSADPPRRDGNTVREGGPFGASLPSQRVMAWARLPPAATRAGMRWSSTCSWAHEWSSVRRSEPAAPTRSARLSPAQPIVSS